MPDRYAVAGRSTDTAATADHAAAVLENVGAVTKSIFLRELHALQVDATASHHGLTRWTGTSGTPAATSTPDIDSHYSHRYAPVSGTILELGAFSVQPGTIAGPYLYRANIPAAAGAGYIWVFNEGIEVLTTDMIGVATPVATALQTCDFSFVWDE